LNTSFVLQSKLPASGGYAPYTISTGARIATDHELQIIDEGSDTFTVYPNPASSQYLMLESDEIIQELSVYSSNGVRVHSDIISGKTKTIETAEWVEGIYILKAVTAQGKIRAVKVIK
jgi:hypothetical protein